MPGESSKPIFDVPIPLAKILNEDKKEDCPSCRAVGSSYFFPPLHHIVQSELITFFLGSAAFIGLGAYTFFSGRSQLRQREEAIMMAKTRWGIGARRLGIYGIAASLVGMGVYRAVM